MNFTDEEIKEFMIEAHELLDIAEDSLLALDQGESFSKYYDAIFRSFHSVKGASGMMEMGKLQAHLHQLETAFSDRKQDSTLSKKFIDFFLRGTDAAREILEGKEVQFDFNSTNGYSEVIETKQASVLSEKKSVSKSLGKVLVVDDESDIVAIVTDELENSGFEAKGVSDPFQVMGVIESFSPDAVITDISMPGMDGVKLLALIKQKHFDLPVIFLSGHVDKTHLMSAIQSGVFTVLEKPFKSERVVESCLLAVKRYQLVKILNRTLNLIMYQFADLSDFLKAQGKEDVEKAINFELKQLLEQRRLYHSANAKAGG
jgi:CheY-like chemotaxis protein/HPt (histidine-containing phosphotransfer) domain-containing protein